MSRAVDVLLDTPSSLSEVGHSIADALGGNVSQESDAGQTCFEVKGCFGLVDILNNFYIDDCGIPFESYSVVVGVHGAAYVGNGDDHDRARLALARRIARIFEVGTRLAIIDDSRLVVFSNAP